MKNITTMPDAGQIATSDENILVKITTSPDTNELQGAFSIEEFCKAHGGFTRQHFHSLINRGLGPRIFKVGKRTMISRQAAADWVIRMETRTAMQMAA